jgi:hypothetical protein
MDMIREVLELKPPGIKPTYFVDTNGAASKFQTPAIQPMYYLDSNREPLICKQFCIPCTTFFRSTKARNYKLHACKPLTSWIQIPCPRTNIQLPCSHVQSRYKTLELQSCIPFTSWTITAKPWTYKSQNCNTRAKWLQIALHRNDNHWLRNHVIHWFEPQCIGYINNKIAAHLLSE